MIVTRTPLRISIGGGGTDLPSYYRQFGGFVISAAITRYVYIAVHAAFSPGYFLKYSESEYSPTLGGIRHRLIREALTALEVKDGIEIASFADVPAGTGLGSSGSFLVGLLHGIYAHRGEVVSTELLASQAAEIEMDRLGDPVGKQDQYSAAYGGLLCQEYDVDGRVSVFPLRMSRSAVAALRESLMLFYVGEQRSSAQLLEDQKSRSEAGDLEMIEGLHFIRQLGLEIRRELEAGNVDQFGGLMHQHWLRKRRRSAGISSDPIDEAYEYALRHGATGGKLVGAGGGGFLLFQTIDREQLRRAMAEIGLKELEFFFDFQGSVVQLQDAVLASQ